MFYLQNSDFHLDKRENLKGMAEENQLDPRKLMWRVKSISFQKD